MNGTPSVARCASDQPMLERMMKATMFRYPTLLSRGAAVAFASALLIAGSANAQDASPPVIAGFGAIAPAKDVANRPDPSLRYRVAFDVTRAAPGSNEINPALDRVARFVNLLGASGIRPAAGDIVIIIHGPATLSILSDAASQARFQQNNPNTQLLGALRRAGVAIHVCGYALEGRKVGRDEVADGVEVDLAAMMTLANLQLKGWAIIPG